MVTASDVHEATAAGGNAAPSAPRAALVPPLPAAQGRSPFSGLPEGWSVLGRCRSGTGFPGPHATGCYALANPEVGVALIDIVPDATPNAEARLRRTLAAAELGPGFPRDLPMIHERMEMAALRSLPWVLDKWFAALPAPANPGGTAWLEGVRAAMAADPAWELPGQTKAVPDPVPLPPDPDGVAVPAPRSIGQPRRFGRTTVLAVAFLAVFGLGLASGVLLKPSAEESPAAPAALKPRSADAAPGAPAAATADTGRGRVDDPGSDAAAATSASATPADAPKAMSDGASATSAIPATSTPPPAAPPADAVASSAADAPAPQPAAGADAGRPLAASASTEHRSSAAVPAEEVLPLAPPRAPAPPPMRVSAASPGQRTVPVIDRACSQALFRFQQGERLTATDQAFIRSGCTTARR